MIRSFLKKGLGKILGGSESPSTPTGPKAYPFKYDAAAPTPEPEPEPEDDHGHSHSHSHAAEPEPEPTPEPVAAAPEPVEETVQEPQGMPSDEELAFISVPELRKRLAAFDIKPRSKANKAELIGLLREAHAGGDDGSASVEEDAPAGGGLSAVEVQELLDDMVRPALQADGGDINLVKVDGMDVHVRLVGACTTCPSSIMTMKMGVEALFKEEFPGFGELIQVD